jgi:dTDP-4-amino-4,6-dideoxygalactose transaminase
MSNDKIWLSPPHIGKLEWELVKEAFETNWIAPVGPHISRFEEELAAYLGAPYCTALSSGTAAIHLALILAGVKEGDEVICSSFTFSGSCNPIHYLRATPVFVDSEAQTWNMDAELLEAAITDRISKTGKTPKAIILVHLYGMPAHVDAVMAVAHKYNIPVIEDAAEALGARFNGQAVGTFGEYGVFSFNGNKIITTSGGGALVARQQAAIQRAHFLATQARENAPHYEHREIGYNYRLSNVSAAIGRGQLTVLDERIKQRRAVYQFYRESLAPAGIQFLDEPDTRFFSNRWLTTVLFNNFAQRERVRNALQVHNIESRPLWKPMHLQPVFQNSIQFVNGVSEELFNRGLCLPSGSALSQIELNRVIYVIIQAL